MNVPSNFTYRTTPRGKQAEAIESTWDWNEAAFLARPGTGKSKMLLDQAAMNWCADNIDAMLVIAPDGVDRQWLREAIPNHLAIEACRAFNYASSMGVRAFDQIEQALRHHRHDAGLFVLTISYDGLQTKRGMKLARDLIQRQRVMCVADESHRCSNVKSVVHRTVKSVMRGASKKRIATGTLIRQNPYSAYGQFDLMGEALLGFGSLSAFKSMYAEMLPENNWLVKQLLQKVPHRAGKPLYIPQVEAKDEWGRTKFRNLQDLRKRLLHYSVMLTLADVNGTEPVVNQTTIYVTLTDQQRRMYQQMRQWGVAQAPGGQLTAEGSLALSIRLAQIAGGHAPCDDDWSATPIEGGNPKIDALRELADELGEDKLVVWCRFTPEIIAVVEALREKFGVGTVVEYHGRMSQQDKDASKATFIHDPGVRFFVGQIRAGGTGLDGLQAVCRYMAFFSNEYPYVERLQAVSRLARTGGHDVVQVYDLMAEGTIDEDVVQTLNAAQDVSERVLTVALQR